MKKIIDIDFTNFKLSSVDFFVKSPLLLVDSRFDFYCKLL